MQVEHVTRISFTSGRPAQQQGKFTVSRCLFRKVIVNNQHVFALGHEFLTHGGSRKGSDIEQGGRVGCGRGHDNGIFHRAGILQSLQHVGHRGLLLSHGNVNADDIPAFLVDDRIDRDSGLAGLAVAKDKFPLPTADRNHGVDSLEPCLQRLVHPLAEDNAGSDFFNREELIALNRSFAVQRLAQRVDHTSNQGFTHGHRHDPAGTLDGVTFLDMLVWTENNTTDVVLFQVKSHPENATREFKQLHGHTVS